MGDEQVDVETFTEEIRAWLDANAAASPRDYGAILPPDLADEGRAWQRRIYDAGFAGIHWPVEYGGQGLTPEHTATWIELCARASVPPVLNMVGVVLARGAPLPFWAPAEKKQDPRPR